MMANWPVLGVIGPERLSALRAELGSGPVLVLTHENPDPDALASGLALARMFQSVWGISTRLAYSGLVQRAENRAMLHHLTPDWEHHPEPPSPEPYTALVLVDTQPGAGNHRLPVKITPAVVFDHHLPIREWLSDVPFVEVRPEVGATSSLVYAYLEAAGFPPDPLLATALFYGVKTDTRGLSRGASPLDEEVYIRLLSRLNRPALIQVEQAGLSREYYRAFNHGLEACRVYGPALVVDLESLQWPDLPAEMGDLLIRLEDAKAVLCLGIFEDTLHFSVRTKPLTGDAGLLVQEVVIPPGKAGGHGSMAGGQIPLNGRDVRKLSLEIERRFLAVIGASDRSEPLI